jgi:hypothetical protein
MKRELHQHISTLYRSTYFAGEILSSREQDKTGRAYLGSSRSLEQASMSLLSQCTGRLRLVGKEILLENWLLASPIWLL